MKAVKKIEFTAEVVKEYSYSPVVESLGVQKSTMELWTETGSTKDSSCGAIEWISFIGTKHEDVVASIGVNWKGRTLSDYDGIFSLPKEAIKLLRSCGIIVPKEFE